MLSVTKVEVFATGEDEGASAVADGG